jgi:hypothetical protein
MNEIYLIWILNDDSGEEDLLIAVPDLETAEAYLQKNPLEAPEYYHVSSIGYLER